MDQKKYEEGLKALRNDNFAAGKLSDELLNSVNPGVLAELSCCMWYEEVLQKTSKEGARWVYTNSNDWAPQQGPFDCIPYSKKFGVNCAMPANWVMVDLGIMGCMMRFWGDQYNKFHGIETVGECIGQCCEIIDYTETRPEFAALMAEGKIKDGDIFLAHGHTFIYMGDKKFLAAGHDGAWHSEADAPTEDGAKAVFDSWIKDMEHCANYHYSVNFIIRMRDNYVPRYYRNKEGKLVFNTMCLA